MADFRNEEMLQRIYHRISSGFFRKIVFIIFLNFGLITSIHHIRDATLMIIIIRNKLVRHCVVRSHKIINIHHTRIDSLSKKFGSSKLWF